MTGSLRVQVDARLCVGAGLCVRSAPGVFAQGDNGVSGVARPAPEPEEHAQVQEAAELCPVQAIQIEWQ